MSTIATNLLGRYVLLNDDLMVVDEDQQRIPDGLAEITTIYRDNRHHPNTLLVALRSATDSMHTGISLSSLCVLPRGAMPPHPAEVDPPIQTTPHPQPSTQSTGGETSGRVVGRPRSDPSE